MVLISDVLACVGDGLGVVGCPAPQTPVRWVATNEMQDPRAFLEGGELLLFTGLEMADWSAEDWTTYVKHVAEAKISALALAIGPTHESVPDGLRAACNAENVNLFTVPMETSFVSISQAVANLLEVGDRTAARDAVALQRRLAQAARRKDAMAAIAVELAAYVSGSVWVLSPDAQVIHQTGRTASPHSDVLAELAAEIERILDRGLGATASWASGQEHTVLQPIGLRTPVEAYLAVRTQAPLTDYQRTAVLTSMSMLTLDLESRAEARHWARALARRAFDLLVEGEHRAAQLVMQAAQRRADVDRPLPREAVVVRARGDERRLTHALSALETGRPKGAVVVALSTDEPELDVLAAPRNLESVVEFLGGESLQVGVGASGSIEDVGHSMRTARQALQRTTPTSRTAWWRDLTASGVTSLITAEVRNLLADQTLAALGTSQTDRDELVRVAFSYLSHHGRSNVVAAELGLHRNTVRSRMDEIERLLDCDLDDPSARMTLWVALETIAARTA